jgi:TrmH family RNA methyltransferase
MIPFYKLEKIPRSLRIRKIAKLFGESEHRLLSTGTLPAGEISYLKETLELLIRDDIFSAAAAGAFHAAQAALHQPDIRRPLNTVRHVLLAETGRFPADWDFIDSGGQLDPKQRRSFPGMRIYLEDIRSPFNIGAIFRTAESFGVEKIYLSPLCADPLHPRAERTAMGCAGVLSWERLSADPAAGSNTEQKGKNGFLKAPLFALETGGVRLGDFQFPQKGTMIVGSEELGISPGALALVEDSLGCLTIPSYGAKGSLNVSVAFGIVMQAWAETLAGRTGEK